MIVEILPVPLHSVYDGNHEWCIMSKCMVKNKLAALLMLRKNTVPDINASHSSSVEKDGIRSQNVQSKGNLLDQIRTSLRWCNHKVYADVTVSLTLVSNELNRCHDLHVYPNGIKY